ncbi:MAG TPA: lipid A biosynthesis acyltransferase [Gammaproteobacteria bacterium]
MSGKRPFWTVRFAWLRYAVVWLGYALMRALVRLPFSWQLWAGKRLGDVARVLLPGRRRVAARNLEVCFPELSPAERERILREHFRALGASLVEMAMGWFGDEAEIRRRVRVEGAEHLSAALERKRGVILFSAHLTTFEFFFPVLAPLCPRLCGMYKVQRNPAMNRIMNKGRGRNFDVLFTKDSVREMLKLLADNAVVWYASDQSYGRKGAALIPFFGEPAMTNTAISRIARASGAAVLPYFCRRLPDDTYVMSIGAPLEGLPSDDPVEDARRLTRVLEDFIRRCPEQYWWIHKRFKGRPAPYPDLYAFGK